MNINRMKDIFKKEDAAGLVLALMVLVVLAVLGIAVAGVTIGSHKLGDIGRDSSSAYYIAEAGANLAYEKIKSGVMPAYTNSNNETIYFTNVADLITAFNPEVYAEESFEIQFGDQPKATVTISGPEDHDDGKLYTIESVGEIGGKSRTVEKPFLVKYVEIIADGETMPFLPPSAALIVKGKVEMGNSSIINGDVYTDSQSKGSFELKNSAKVTGYIYSSYKGKLEDIVALGNSASYGGLAVPDAQILWPAYESMLDMIKMPENEESYTNIGSINLANSKSETIEINENVILTNISLSNSSKLLINNLDNDINIIVKELSLSNSATISFAGEGKVNIFIENKFELDNSASINENGNTSKLRIYYFGNNKVSLGNSSTLNGNLLIKKGNLEVDNSGQIKGAIISGGKSIIIKNSGVFDAPMIVIPYGNLNVNNSGTIKGITVTESADLSNSSKIIYSTFDSGILFPDSVSVPGEGPGSGFVGEITLDVLISSKPALEP